jgi:hypothetical protein
MAAYGKARDSARKQHLRVVIVYSACLQEGGEEPLVLKKSASLEVKGEDVPRQVVDLYVLITASITGCLCQNTGKS